MESKLQEYAPGSNRAEFKRMLGVHHNRNDGAWSNIARKLGILERTQNDWKSSQQLHEFAKDLIPDDPSKLDFALFGLGAIENF